MYASFVWVLSQQKALQHIQDAVQTSLSLEPADWMVLEVSVADRCS